MNKLNKLYEAMLKSWGCVISEDAAINLNFSGNVVPVKVDDKQLYLATSENLNGITVGKVFFHPACESIMSKETEVFKVVRKLTSAKIFAMFQPMVEVIFNVAGKKSGKTLNGKMLEALEPFKVATKTVKQEVIDILKTMSIAMEDGGIDTRLINFSMIKGGKTDNDEAIYYSATPSFPFYTELCRTIGQNDHVKASDRVSFNNLNVSMQSLRTAQALFELIIPACVDPSRKKYSATISDAARLVAYLHSYGLVASDMNSLIGKFRKEFDSIGIYGIDLDWLSELDEIGEIRKLIPSLDYNNYNITSTAEQPAANGVRVSSYNPLTSVLNTSSNNAQPQPGAQVAGTSGPKVPDAQPGETYIGSEYNPVNGVYEFKYQQQNGYIRVKSLSEEGRFISEFFQNPAQQTTMPGMPAMMPGMGMPTMMPGMMPGMGMPMGSGIPMLGLPQQPGMGGFVRDPYTGAFVPAGGQPMQQPTPMPGMMPGNTGLDIGFGTGNINQY